MVRKSHFRTLDATLSSENVTQTVQMLKKKVGRFPLALRCKPSFHLTDSCVVFILFVLFSILYKNWFLIFVWNCFEVNNRWKFFQGDGEGIERGRGRRVSVREGDPRPVWPHWNVLHRLEIDRPKAFFVSTWRCVFIFYFVEKVDVSLFPSTTLL